MVKLYPVVDEKRAQDVLSWGSRHPGISFTHYPVDADYILVAGGDGRMLGAIHDLRGHRKPFLGVNSPTDSTHFCFCRPGIGRKTSVSIP